mgnify:CR=1 FL=1
MGNVRSVGRAITRHQNSSKKTEIFFYKGKILSQVVRSDGRRVVSGSFGSKRFSLLVHRAVLMAFKGMPPDGCEACHNNGIPSDNMLANLRWDTHANNMRDKINHENAQRGETHAGARVTEAQAIMIIKGEISATEAHHLFGIAKATARAIRRGDTWAKVHQKIQGQS